ncbi:dipicolinate synthase subunit DpsA [Virgibacillus sp. W0181]|uniref:dipicolinate synthase subunit DpsA n=1 Tax=Virgibacillus sp. W0181 TaxID=3391581 RepID=UPI003F47B609
MFNHLNILIIGGDERYLHVIKELASQKATLYLAGFDQLDFSDEHIIHTDLSSVAFEKLDAVILPVTGTTMEGKIKPTYANADIVLTKDMINTTSDSCVIYTGVANSHLEEITRNRDLTRIFVRDDVAIMNSIPTAEATLKLAIEHTDRTVHGANVCVTGFGRVGFTVARLFANVGAKVAVAVRNSTDMARIKELGMKPISINQIQSNAPETDIIINTIPHPVIDAQVVKQMNSSALIIDLASAPGGTDFASAEAHRIKTLHALGLPGKTAPATAGEIIAKTLVSLIKEQL